MKKNKNGFSLLEYSHHIRAVELEIPVVKVIIVVVSSCMSIAAITSESFPLTVNDSPTTLYSNAIAKLALMISSPHSMTLLHVSAQWVQQTFSVRS